MSYDVFLSHNSKDKVFVGGMADWLTTYGGTAFLDERDPRKPGLGQRFSVGQWGERVSRLAFGHWEIKACLLIPVLGLVRNCLNIGLKAVLLGPVMSRRQGERPPLPPNEESKTNPFAKSRSLNSFRRQLKGEKIHSTKGHEIPTEGLPGNEPDGSNQQTATTPECQRHEIPHQIKAPQLYPQAGYRSAPAANLIPDNPLEARSTHRIRPNPTQSDRIAPKSQTIAGQTDKSPCNVLPPPAHFPFSAT